MLLEDAAFAVPAPMSILDIIGAFAPSSVVMFVLLSCSVRPEDTRRKILGTAFQK